MADPFEEAEEPDAVRDMARLIAQLGDAMETVEAEYGRGATWHLMQGLRLHMAEIVSCDAGVGSDEHAAARAAIDDAAAEEAMAR